MDMKKWVEWLAGRCRVFFRKRPGNVTRSQLMGLYLTQTNRRNHYFSEYKMSRERRNGKYSHRRERDS